MTPSEATKFVPDTHTKLFIALVQGAVKKWMESPPTDQSVRPPLWEKKLPLKKIGVGDITVPTTDEDWPPRTFKEAFLVWLLATPLIAFKDNDGGWTDAQQAIDVVNQVLPPGKILPAPDHVWEEMTSDAAMERLAFRSVGTWYLTRINDEEEKDEVAWKIDFGFMHGFDVREGFERYGAIAYFGKDQSIHHIHWCHAEKDVFPGDPEWEHAKWVWKSTMLVGITVVDHLTGVHWSLANPAAKCTREALAADHPVRRLMHPFTFRTVTINFKASFSLLPVRGFVHRAASMTAASHQDALNAAAGLVSFETFPDRCKRQRLMDLIEVSPPVQDGLDYWNVIHSFVCAYLDNHYAERSVTDDEQVIALWAALKSETQLQALGELTRENLTNYLTQTIWGVTGLHQYVGSLVELVLNPTFAGTKIRPDCEISDIQSTFQAILIIGLTGLTQPPLIGDYTHIMLTDPDKASMEKFQANLAELAKTIDERNKLRPDAFQSFNPRILSSSVSI